jgi:hypothetical protein
MDDFVKFFIIPIAVISLTIIVLAIGLSWVASCKAAEVINVRQGTHYSCGDYFWAADAINAQTQTLQLRNKSN